MCVKNYNHSLAGQILRCSLAVSSRRCFFAHCTVFVFMETETRRTNKMASSPNADNNDTCSSFLFTKDDCTPLKFFIRPSETKVKLKALIEVSRVLALSEFCFFQID